MLNASVSLPPAWIQVPKHDADLVGVFLFFFYRMLNYIFWGDFLLFIHLISKITACMLSHCPLFSLKI